MTTAAADIALLQIAKVCHEANKAYCETMGDFTQLPWDKAMDWQKKSAVEGVRFHLSGDHSPEESHNSWMQQKKDDGWTYGPTKDIDQKKHPCMLPYQQLPLKQRMKDVLFINIVQAFKDKVAVSQVETMTNKRTSLYAPPDVKKGLTKL